jgi:hypothetical protein
MRQAITAYGIITLCIPTACLIGIFTNGRGGFDFVYVSVAACLIAFGVVILSSRLRHKWMHLLIGVVLAPVLAFASSVGGLAFLPAPQTLRKDGDRVIRQKGGYGVFRTECEELFRAVTNEESRPPVPADYPPLIAALRPQFIEVEKTEPPFLVIQTSGGFYHRGFVIVMDTNLSYKPEWGGSLGLAWEQRAPGIWEFKE